MASLREQSFGASFLKRYGDRALFGGEIVPFGTDLVASEELCDRVYRFYLMLMAKGWSGDKEDSGPQDLAFAYANGFYFPCVQRFVLTGQVDIDNDGLPEIASQIMELGEGAYEFFSCRRAPAPTGWASLVRGPTYKLSILRKDRKDADRLVLEGVWFGVSSADGQVRICLKTGLGPALYGKMVRFHSIYCAYAATTLNIWTDRLHLWEVQTAESIIGDSMTPLRLGVSEEHVKSLFYARDTPLTETGRRRPILHWVHAHRRRLQKGIDVPVERHLRGTVEFEMAGFPFRIVRPMKGPGSLLREVAA